MADKTQIEFTDNMDEVTPPMGGWEAVEGPKPPAQEEAPPPSEAAQQEQAGESGNQDDAQEEAQASAGDQAQTSAQETAASEPAAAAAAPAPAQTINIPPSPQPDGPPTEIRSAVLSNLQPSSVDGASGSLNFLMDVSVSISVELGKTRLKIEDLLQLTNGSVIKLDKLVDEPIDLLVNGKLMARGEIVVVDDFFGIRVSEIVG